MQMSKEKLNLAYPELVQEIEAVGFEKGKAEGQSKAVEQAGPSPEELADIKELKRLQDLAAKGLLEEERARAMFNGNPEIQAEFRNFESFFGYYRNRERVKIVGGKTIGGGIR